MYEDNRVELFEKYGLVYEVWIEYQDMVYCKATEVADIVEALQVLEQLEKRPNVRNVYIKEVRTTGHIIVRAKG